MKRWLVVLVLLLPILAACGGAAPAEEEAPAAEEEAPAAEAEAPAAEEGGEMTGDMAMLTPATVDQEQLSDELFLFNWSEYIDPQILLDFEAEYGVTVVQDLFDSNEAMIPRIRAGNSGYDIVVPSDYAVKIMVDEELLAPLDEELLPGRANIDPNLMNMYYDPDNAYSVPYFWGTTGLAYNTQFFDEPPTSWSAIFEPSDEVAGNFTMLEDTRETPGAALIYLGESINTTDEAQLAAAEELLLAQKPAVASYDSANVNFKLASEEIILAHIWSGTAGQAILGVGDTPGNENIAYLIPDEGGVIWQDNLAIVADSPNQYTAHVFIDYLLRPDVAARNTDWVLYLTPNMPAQELLAEETVGVFEAGLMPDDATMERLSWIERNEDTDTLYADLWTRVRSE